MTLSYQNKSPYVLALIDGDGVLYKHEYIRDGLDGGKRAAKDLHTTLKEQCGIYKDDVRIEVKVITNLSGLARAIKRDGIVTFETEFRDFAQGFTQALSSFDFVDVGKIARWYLQAFNCKHLLLGISHDSGYAPFLDEIYTSSEVGSRISLIEATPTHKHIARTGISIINMADSIFRADKICEGPPTLNSDDSPLPTFATQSGCSAPLTALQSRGASPPPRIKLLIPPKASSTSKKATPPWNPGPRGQDPPLIFNQASVNSIKNRGDGKKLCNLYFLRNTCPRNIVDCPFDHRHKVTKDELGAIAFLARITPCQYGQDCPNTDCVYGHNCPTVREGTCVNAYCKFTVAQHPPNTKFRNTYVLDS
ncbi:hypothetical protein Cpir12675_001162 [Ceratocystis pirilliformis]|uniref:C3H1-type domain-containing protein n=1 Tax=Ceratocystis pirilliformis TaxID=259994 RepID=A0ABR3ZGY8_9PEZI